MAHSHAQKAGEVLAISQQPSLHFAYRNPKAEMRSRIRQPFGTEHWRAVRVVVKIHEDNPMRKASRLTEAGDSLTKAGLALTPVDGIRLASCMLDESPEDSFVYKSFDRSVQNEYAQPTHASANKAS